MMERGAWTEERLDDLATSMREGFARMDTDIRDLRGELHSEIGGLRGEMQAGFAQLRGEMAELRQLMLRVGGGMIAAMCIGFLSILVAVLARGV